MTAPATPRRRSDASAMPPDAPASWRHAAFYRFVPLADPVAVADRLRQLAAGCGLQGSILVAGEGVNGAVAGCRQDVAAFEAALDRADVCGGLLRGLAFRHSDAAFAPFGRLSVGTRTELVASGLPHTTGGEPPTHAIASADTPADGSVRTPADASLSGGLLAPDAWDALLDTGDCVLVDNRNHFEVRLGRFHGAQDPQAANFRDFSAFIQARAPAWRAAGRPVAMYCTGGIRCEKTAPWLRSLGLQVLQLEGGILRYLAEAADPTRHWQGDCYVFDRRLALDAGLRPSGATPADVFDAGRPDEAWRLQRALRLAD